MNFGSKVLIFFDSKVIIIFGSKILIFLASKVPLFFASKLLLFFYRKVPYRKKTISELNSNTPPYYLLVLAKKLLKKGTDPLVMRQPLSNVLLLN
jgi:hypothetical protein